MYENDSNRRPDEAFAPGCLRHVRAGNVGRMLDPRRTPVRIVGMRPEVGMFELEVTAFEDKGARWVLPLEDVGKFQFELDAADAARSEIAEFRAAVRRSSEALSIAVEPEALASTATRIAAEAVAAADWLRARSRFLRDNVDLDTATTEGPRSLRSDLRAYLESRGVADIERELTTTWVSNPDSGEVVKGHAITLARLGLAPYDGLVTRDPASFRGAWTRSRRERHIIARLGFLRSVCVSAGVESVVLYRSLSFEHPRTDRRDPTLISATFRRSVAEAWLDSDASQVAVTLMRQPVPIERLFMTYLETDAMNGQFRESEAVLFARPAGPLF